MEEFEVGTHEDYPGMWVIFRENGEVYAAMSDKQEAEARAAYISKYGIGRDY